MNRIARFVGAQFIAPGMGTGNTTKQGAINHAPTWIRENGLLILTGIFGAFAMYASIILLWVMFVLLGGS